MRWGKWPILDLFWVRGWPYRAKKRDNVLTIFPMFLVILCIYSRLLDHVFSLFYCPYFFISLYFYYKYSTHTTRTHTRTHTCTPATDRDLESGLSESVCVNTRKTSENAWKRQSQGKLWRRLVAMLTGKSFVCGEVTTDQSNHFGAGSLRSFFRFQGKKRMIRGIGNRVVLDLFSNLKLVRSCGYFRWTSRASDNTTWTNLCKQKFGDEG